MDLALFLATYNSLLSLSLSLCSLSISLSLSLSLSGWFLIPLELVSILGYTKNKKIHQTTLPFFSELPIGIRNPNLLKFSKLDQIPRMATHFSDDQFLLYIYTSAHTVEPNCDGIHIRYHGYKQCV